MAPRPLVLSVQGPEWKPRDGQGRGTGALSPCLCCGLPADGWSDAAIEDGPCCRLCALSLHLERRDLDRDATLIWLPEMAQGALNLLTRQIHLMLHGARQSPRLGATNTEGASEDARAARVAYNALAARGEAAGARFGTTRPSDLGAALLRLSKDEYAARAGLLGGVRLLALGQLHDRDRDIYPTLLAGWALPPAHSHGDIR